MRGYRFYLKFENNKAKRKSGKQNIGHSGNCLAAYLREDGHFDWYMDGKMACCDAACAIFFHPNSDVCTSSVGFDYLRENCKRVSEKVARQIHPKLFQYLEQE